MVDGHASSCSVGRGHRSSDLPVTLHLHGRGELYLHADHGHDGDSGRGGDLAGREGGGNPMPPGPGHVAAGSGAQFLEPDGDAEPRREDVHPPGPHMAFEDGSRAPRRSALRRGRGECGAAP
jgi:hypothetical protein